VKEGRKEVKRGSKGSEGRKEVKEGRKEGRKEVKRGSKGRNKQRKNGRASSSRRDLSGRMPASFYLRHLMQGFVFCYTGRGKRGAKVQNERQLEKT
jgi:hypothetical protein